MANLIIAPTTLREYAVQAGYRDPDRTNEAVRGRLHTYMTPQELLSHPSSLSFQVETH